MICSLAAVGAAYCRSTDHSGFFNDFLLNLGTEIFGIAITVGFVDFLFAWRNKRQHLLSVKPRALDLLDSIKFLKVAYDRYLAGPIAPPADAIERYCLALRQTTTTATRLGTLVEEQEPKLASKLASYVRYAESQFADFENAIAAVRYAAMDAAVHIERVRTEGQRFLELAYELRSEVSTIYTQTSGFDEEDNS